MFNIFSDRNSYEDKPVFIMENGVITIDILKILVNEKINVLKEQNKKVCIISDDNHFEFAIKFLAAISLGKEIFLGSEESYDYCLQNKSELSCFRDEQTVEEKDSLKTIINFFTSGSSGKPKVVKKTLFNLIREAEDINKIFFEEEKDLIFSTTTVFRHLFGMTFCFMTPLVGGYTIDLRNKNFPENIKEKNNCLVTSPSFLAKIKKYCTDFAETPRFIIAAGAKLQDDVFKYFEKKSDIIEIYGSTETGIIAYRTDSCYNYLTKFPNIKIEQIEEKNYKIVSDYFYEREIELNDEIVFTKPDKMLILGRSDSILKINEKRISSVEVENLIKASEFAEDAYCLKIEEKLAAAVVLTSQGVNFFRQQGQVELIKKLKSEVNCDIKPQKWRFLPEIFKTDTGKVDKDKIEEIFLTKVSFPLVLNQKISKHLAEYRLFFPLKSNFFKGHFTSFKILPGIAELFFVLFFANSAFKIPKECQVMKKIKFSHLIFPDTEVTLKLYNNEKSVDFEFISGEKLCSSGTIIKTNIFKIE